ncbi:MAG: aminoacyl-tRNA hydrolase [Candidatus Omnitrophica bacterium]|nr:aminoacyl-tRNA hydrolase [Candidatus Omnitrophota bacterium]
MNLRSLKRRRQKRNLPKKRNNELSIYGLVFGKGMKLIVGLGNPGPRYKNTKHNAGFWVIDHIAGELGITCNKRSFNAQWAQGSYNRKNILLIKPLTFMNLSGRAVKSFADYFKISFLDILLVFDDVDLCLGTVRLRAGGGAGGHNGVRSVLESLGTETISRVRLGIRTEPEIHELAGYVLSEFRTKEDNLTAKTMVATAAEAVLCWLEKDIDFAMNRYNKKGGKS